MVSLPRFFIAEGEPTPLPAAETGPQPIDQFRMDGQTWMVTANHEGWLQLRRREDCEELGAAARGDLNAHELAGPLRELRAALVWLMAIEGLKKRENTSGWNDPLEVAGMLFGPFPSPAPMMVRGHLSTTRGELQDGILVGSWTPFHPETAANVLLAGESPDELAAGRGVILAYETNVRKLLHALLSAIRIDQQGEAPGKLAEQELPVPSRAELESTLVARGFRVRGDLAERRRPGFLGLFFHERVVLPPEGAVSDLLALARVALSEMPGWPTPRARLLHERVGLAEVSWTPESPAGLSPLSAGSPFTIEDGVLISPVGNHTTQNTGHQGRVDKSFRSHPFAVDPAFAAHCGPAVALEVEYQDWGTSPENISAGYTMPGEDKYAGGRSFVDTGEWERMTLALDGPEFRGKGAHGDFWIMIKALQPILIRRVTLRRAQPRVQPRQPPPPQVPPPQPPVPPIEAPATREPVSWPAEQWKVLHQVQLRVADGRLLIEATGTDPHLGGPHIRIKGPVEAVFRFKSTGSGIGELFWSSTEHHWGDAHPVHFPVIHDGEWHDFRLRIFEQRVITMIRLDPGNEPGKMELDGFTLVPVESPVLPEPPAADRVVYFDPRYPGEWARGAARIAEQLEKKGFIIVDAAELAAWMRARFGDRAAGSVCVMALDVMPDTVFESVWPDATARRYMDAGGRLVWGGAMPFAARGLPDGTRHYAGGHHSARHVIGFAAHAGDVPEAPEITDEGRAWGMQLVGPSGIHVANVADVTVVLARVGRFYAASWIKTYNPAFPGSGLLRYRNNHVYGQNDAEIEDMARVAVYGLPPR